MPETAFFSFSLILLIALILAVAAYLLRQPLIIAYIIAGMFAGPLFLQLTTYPELVELFAHLGVAFLLFVVGLSLDYTRVKQLGRVIFLVGIAQIICTALVSFVIVSFMGITIVPALYISIALTFSSTIIVIKLLIDKHELDTLYGRLSLGILLLQDLAVVFIMTGLSTFLVEESNPLTIIGIIIKVAVLLVALWAFTKYLLSRMLNFLARSMDLLFLFSICWVVLLGAIVAFLGLSMEIGALLAGIALAASPYQLEISNRVKFLRDFFIIMFFIWLGMQMNLSLVPLWPMIILSLFVIIGKPLIVMLIMKRLGYMSRIGFYTGTALSQISEFSIVLILFGHQLGHVGADALSLITVVALITILTSTYLIKYMHWFYSLLAPVMNLFEPRTPHHVFTESKPEKKSYPIILFGHNRIGFSLVRTLLKKKKKFQVIDYNPGIIHQLKKEKIPCVYGDAGNIELLDNLLLDKTKMIISTLPDIDTNLLLIHKVRGLNNRCVLIVTAQHVEQALLLYNAGAHYVILPHFLGGRHVATLIEQYGFNAEKFIAEKIRHCAELNHHKRFGHGRPHPA